MPLLSLTTPSLYHVQIWICNHYLCAFIAWAYLLAIGFYWTYSWLVSAFLLCSHTSESAATHMVEVKLASLPKVRSGTSFYGGIMQRLGL